MHTVQDSRASSQAFLDNLAEGGSLLVGRNMGRQWIPTCCDWQTHMTLPWESWVSLHQMLGRLMQQRQQKTAMLSRKPSTILIGGVTTTSLHPGTALQVDSIFHSIVMQAHHSPIGPRIVAHLYIICLSVPDFQGISRCNLHSS